MTTAGTEPGIRIASAPVSFGVDEIMRDDEWMPGPGQTLDAIQDIGYAGTELGPPGFLGSAEEVRSSLARRGLEFVGSFIPLHLDDPVRFATDLDWLAGHLRFMTDASPEGSRPVMVLAGDFDNQLRFRWAGRIPEHPEARLSNAALGTIVENLHRAAELCRSAGFDAAVHPHAGTIIEAPDEIRAVLDASDPSILGFCLDTGHARFGGSDPSELARDYAARLRHVHLKDCATGVIARGHERGEGLDEMLRSGVFCEFGTGDADIPQIVDTLRAAGYAGWIVVEQDQYLSASDSIDSVIAGQQRNLDYLRDLGL